MVRINMVRSKVRGIGRGGLKPGAKSRDRKAEATAALKKAGRPVA